MPFTANDYEKLHQLMNSSPEIRELLQKLLDSQQYTISKISHEVRNPLTLIYSTFQLIESSHPETRDFSHWSELREDIEYTISLLQELRSIQSAVRCGLQSAGKQVAESFAEIPVLNPISLHADLVNAVGKERMDRSMIVGGSGGVSCKRSWAIPGMGVLELTAEYEVELPVPVFHIPVLHYKEKMRMKTWTGYVKTYEAGIGDNELVYVTETGIVYHRNYQCTYLEPSVRSVAKTQLGELRNSSGGIYHLCERCGWMPGNDGNCYVTDYGDRYHTSLSCSGLKRKVYTVPLSEVKGKGACSKCGGK